MTPPPFPVTWCPLCKGKGITVHLKLPCTNCGGRGWLPPKEVKQ